MTSVFFNFDSILDSIVDLYFTIYGSAYLLWEWFSSTIHPDLAELINYPPTTTYIELLFGPLMIVMLIVLLVGTIMKSLVP